MRMHDPGGVASLLAALLGGQPSVRLRAYDGSAAGDPEATAAIVVRSPDALSRILTAPGELGFCRAYVTGDLDLEGDMFDVLRVVDDVREVRPSRQHAATYAALAKRAGLRRLPPPPEEARLHGRRHSRARDAAAISYHYDVSNEFYRLVLGPSLTYSCAVWSPATETLEDAQAAKYELICRKLDLRPGMRLLDVGCGWGGMLLHAAHHHGVDAVGVTLSHEQAELARKRVVEAGLADRVEVRFADFRDVSDGPYDAISSIGMFEHVGLSELAAYFERCHALLAERGRLLNHAIGRPGHAPTPRWEQVLHGGYSRAGLHRTFFDRYVFPDGELHEVGSVVSAMQAAGFEVRHLESLREHYALTLRRWLVNLETNWDAAVREAGEARARVWRLYIAVAALGFERDQHQIHQVLATATAGGDSGMPLRPDFT
jgi:cyclopropane-fatty-acyl-phospholipid synthase